MQIRHSIDQWGSWIGNIGTRRSSNEAMRASECAFPQPDFDLVPK
jgi:hypothetical protein